MYKSATLCVLLACAHAALAADWPSFRGPARDGISTERLFPANKAFEFKQEWRKPLGSGYSGISVVGKNAVTMFSDGSNDIVIAFDPASGQERWRYVLGPMYKGHSGSNDGPTSTPTIDGDQVYALDPHGHFVALSLADGTKKWGFQLGNEVVARVPHYGFTTVPTVIGSAVVLMTGEKGRALTAFDRATGKQLWSAGDDTCTYQSPLVWNIGGRQHLLAITDNFLMELNPADGAVLWQAPHKVNDDESYAVPVFIGENQLLIQDRRQVAAFRLDWQDNKANVTELWRNNSLRGTYALPVTTNGLIFGFRAQFLHCLDAATGEVKWRSRPPGGQGLTLVDGHLLIIGGDGRLVAVEATGEAYREKASLQLFKGDSYTAPTVADGKLYLRDLEELAQVSIVAASQAATSSAAANPKVLPKPEGQFGEFVAKLAQTADKKAAIDAYLEGKTTPIIEADGLVTYLFRGQTEDMAVSRAFEEYAMTRIPDTDLYYYTERLALDGHWSYFLSSFGDRQLDTRNPLVVDNQNELRMPNWKAPDYFKADVPRGQAVEKSCQIADGGERKYTVYLPHGYADSSARYPVVYFPSRDGLTRGNLDLALDNLIAQGSISPTILVFVDLPRPEANEPDKFIDQLINSVVPAVDAEFRTQATASARGLMGFAQSANVSSLAAVKAPKLFGKLITQSLMFFGKLGETLQASIATGSVPASALIILSHNDYKFPGLDANADSAQLANLLAGKGTAVSRHETGGFPSWGQWRAQFGEAMRFFAPATTR